MPSAPGHHRAHAKPAVVHDSREYGAAARGYDWKWQKDKAAALKQMILDTGDPFCRYCRKAIAKTLDHGIPPSKVGAVESVAYERQFRDQRYWVPACMRCNSDKGDAMPLQLKRRRPEMFRRLVEVLRERGIELFPERT